MTPIPLEDLAEDIISKAQRGLEIPTEDLATLADLPKSAVIAARKGQEVTHSDIRKIAKALRLNPDKLLTIWKQSWYPIQPDIKNVITINTPFYDMSVNAYLYVNFEIRSAILFDTGVDASPILKYLNDNQLKLESIIITHTHRDHIEALDGLRANTDCSNIYSPHKELLPDTTPIQENETLKIDGFPEIQTLNTSGHCVGGLSYYLEDVSNKLCFVGDSIFAGSMGGGMISYKDALHNNVENILSLPKETILFPGHGPLTSVANELDNNPFF